MGEWGAAPGRKKEEKKNRSFWCEEKKGGPVMEKSGFPLTPTASNAIEKGEDNHHVATKNMRLISCGGKKGRLKSEARAKPELETNRTGHKLHQKKKKRQDELGKRKKS